MRLWIGSNEWNGAHNQYPHARHNIFKRTLIVSWQFQHAPRPLKTNRIGKSNLIKANSGPKAETKSYRLAGGTSPCWKRTKNQIIGVGTKTQNVLLMHI